MHNKMTRYLANCILLTVPILLWNIAFSSQLPRAYSPEVFWANIPSVITIPENVLRLVVLMLPVLMPLVLTKQSQRTGLVVYLVGVGLYFLSWIPLMLFPDSAWSTSLIGFLAPAYTPLIWAIGIGLIGDSLYLPVAYRSRVYIIVSGLFVCAHCSHVILVYSRRL